MRDMFWVHRRSADAIQWIYKDGRLSKVSSLDATRRLSLPSMSVRLRSSTRAVSWESSRKRQIAVSPSTV